MKTFSITMLGAVLFSYPVLAQDVCVVFPDSGKFNQNHIEEFIKEYSRFTFPISSKDRRDKLKDRISEAKLSLPDKVEILKRLGSRATSPRTDLRITEIILSVKPEELSLFKAALDYDGDYKDTAEYLLDDIDDESLRQEVLSHFKKTSGKVGIKVLTDVDDTMYANLIEARYPKGTVYPGVLEFYDALKQEIFELKKIPLTTLSARPNPIGGIGEDGSLKKILEVKPVGQEAEGKIRLCPSALSGELFSATFGTGQTIVRKVFPSISHGQEDKIGEVKLENFKAFSLCYPEYRYVFVGDSGQADALTAQKMVTEAAGEGVVTTFIHDIRRSEDDKTSSSATFSQLNKDIIIRKDSRGGRGVIVFRNYIQAAVIAYTHSATLGGLITAQELATITRSALNQFQQIKFDEKDDSRKRLQEQYVLDAEEACTLLENENFSYNDVQKIRQLLNEKFK